MSFLNIGRLAFRPKTGLVIFIRIDRNKDLHQPKWWKPLKIPVWISYLSGVDVNCVQLHTYMYTSTQVHVSHVYKIKTSSIELADLKKLILDLHTLYKNRSSSSFKKDTPTPADGRLPRMNASPKWLPSSPDFPCVDSKAVRRLATWMTCNAQGPPSCETWATGNRGESPGILYKLTPSWRVCFFSWLKGMFLLVVVNLNYLLMRCLSPCLP